MFFNCIHVSLFIMLYLFSPRATSLINSSASASAKASNCLTAVCCALSLPQAMSSAMRESSRSKSLSSPILIGNLRMMAWIAASRPPAPDAACG